jgi:hypothetical protein
VEKFLYNKKIYVVILLDEFHFVYSMKDTGSQIVAELSNLSGTDKGVVHIIVAGSSSMLRKLAFAKLSLANLSDEEKERYCSYEGKDLNSSKLQPHWIFPLRSADDFKEYCESNKFGDVEKRYLFSGGRIGLINKSPDLDAIPYSVSTKYGNGTEVKSILLRCLYRCSNSYSDCKSENLFSLENMSQLLANVPLSVLHEHVNTYLTKQRQAILDEPEIEKVLFDLVDEGKIIFEDVAALAGDRYVAFASIYVYFKIQATRHRHEWFTWKHAAAMKMPQGIFHEIAEDTAFRILKNKSMLLFNIELENLDRATILKFYDKKNPQASNKSTLPLSTNGEAHHPSSYDFTNANSNKILNQ